MTTITIEPVTPDRWDDAAHTLTGGGDGASCWCLWWYIPANQWSATDRDEKRELLREQIEAGPPRALIAYVDGQPAAWCRIAPRVEQTRIARTQLIKKGTVEALDDPTVWSLSCLVVRKEHRGLGLTAALIAAAVDFARANDARVVEAYPIDTAVARLSPNELYHGTLSTFRAVGFEEVSRPKPDRPIVSLSLAG